MSDAKIIGTYGTMYYVKDVPRASRFYKEALGLTPRFESEEWSEFDVNGHGICLHKWEEAKIKPDLGELIISVQNINGLVADLKKKGVEFMGDVKEVHPGAWCIDMKDLEGNEISLYEDTNKY